MRGENKQGERGETHLRHSDLSRLSSDAESSVNRHAYSSAKGDAVHDGDDRLVCCCEEVVLREKQGKRRNISIIRRRLEVQLGRGDARWCTPS